MSINASSAASFHPQNFYSIFTLSAALAHCFEHRCSFFIFVSFAIANILLVLPLCIFILYLGLQRLWKQRSALIAAAAAAAASNSDTSTYHLVVMEMIGILGCGFFCGGALIGASWLEELGVCFYSVSANGQVFVHIFTCAERYMAVVQPIAYISLKNGGGVGIRKATTCCAWLIFLGSFGQMFVGLDLIMVETFFLSAFSICVVSFCSLSVLCVLIRPRPGKRGGHRMKVDQSKLRAFHTILGITGALLFRFGGHLFVLVIFSSKLSENVRCGALVSGAWFCLPTSLFLPLLFLHREGKLLCCENKSKSGQESE